MYYTRKIYEAFPETSEICLIKPNKLNVSSKIDDSLEMTNIKAKSLQITLEYIIIKWRKINKYPSSSVSKTAGLGLAKEQSNLKFHKNPPAHFPWWVPSNL